MKVITLKYPGVCRDCGRELPKGERARWYGRGKVYCLDRNHGDAPVDDDYVQRQIDRRENAEYERGKAEARQYLNDVAIYGRELAEQWEMEAELNRYNRGED